jgi:hypothetical protein
MYGSDYDMERLQKGFRSMWKNVDLMKKLFEKEEKRSIWKQNASKKEQKEREVKHKGNRNKTERK